MRFWSTSGACTKRLDSRSQLVHMSDGRMSIVSNPMLVVIESMKEVIPVASTPEVSPRDSRQRATLEVSRVFATRSSVAGFIPKPPDPS